MLDNRTQTDSLFTSNMEDISDLETWSDIRLIHESDRGWSVVYSGLYRGRRVAIKGLKPEFKSIRQLCSAVNYMHSRQTVHCDLKPSNIMITRSGFVKIIDFGISRGNGYERLDFPGGTVGYTAPENFNSGSVASVAVDIYSIGILLEKMDRKGMFKGVWKKCLSSDPERRPASVHDIAKLLDQS